MSVNFIVEINALNDWELCHPLSANAYKVMCKLYYLANKQRFPERITVSNRVLMSMVGCSEDSLVKARNQLIQNGRIDYKGAKKVTPVYTIHYFSEENTVYNHDTAGYEQGIKHGYEQGYEQGHAQDIKPGSILKNTKDNENRENEQYIHGETDAAAEEVHMISVQIAERNGHAGNIAYIEGIERRLIGGGEKAIAAARRELKVSSGENRFGYQQHTYTEDDFGDDFYANLNGTFAGVRA